MRNLDVADTRGKLAVYAGAGLPRCEDGGKPRLGMPDPGK